MNIVMHMNYFPAMGNNITASPLGRVNSIPFINKGCQ